MACPIVRYHVMEKENILPGPAPTYCTIPVILGQLFEKYTVEELNELLLQTLYLATCNPDDRISRTEFADCVHAITTLVDTLHKIEKRLPTTPCRIRPK